MMPIQITDIILLVAAAQGLFLTSIIFVKFSRLYAVRFVGFLTLLYSIVLVGLIINDLGYSFRIPHIYMIFIAIPFLIGPLHFLFALHLIHPKRRIRVQDSIHFIPAILVLIFLLLNHYENWIAFPLQSQMDKQAVLPPGLLKFNWTIALHAFFYIGLTFRLLILHSRKIKQMFSSIEKLKLNWVYLISYMALICIIIFSFENLMMSMGINFSNFYMLSSIIVALYVYSFGYVVLIRSEVFTDPVINRSMNQISAQKSHIAPPPIHPKYYKSGLQRDEAIEHKQKLLQFMEEEKPYRDNGLTLNQLSSMLDLSPHNLSEILNTRVKQNFFDFVNSYRIEEVKNDLLDPEKKHLTILGIAFDAGFNSKTAFNTIFKKYVHMTPSEFRKRRTENK